MSILLWCLQVASALGSVHALQAMVITNVAAPVYRPAAWLSWLAAKKLDSVNGTGKAAGFINTDFNRIEFSGEIILAEK